MRVALARVVAPAIAVIFSCFQMAEPGKMIPAYAGPFLAYAERLFMCNETDWSAHGYMRATHFNPARPYEKQRMTGNVTINFNVDDNMWMRARMASRSNNEWKENAFVFNFRGKACSAVRDNIPDVFRLLMESAAKPQSVTMKPCMVPKGVYVLDDDPVDWYFPNFPVLPYGRYRFTLVGGPIRSTVSKFCVGVEAVLIPKPS